MSLYAIKIKNPATVLTLSGLNNNPPRTKQELGESIDEVLMWWSNKLADDDSKRDELDELIVNIVWPYLDRESE